MASAADCKYVTPSKSCKGHEARILTDEESEKLEKEKPISAFKKEKLEVDAGKNWDLFYKRNGTRFFKDRHWTSREFTELLGNYTGKTKVVDKDDGDHLERQTLLEVGSGVGNALFPLLQENPSLFVFACDFSPRAIQLIKENQHYDQKRCFAFQCDVTTDCLTQKIPANSVDIATMIFVLSAILPSKMSDAIANVSKVLKPGGLVLFRDYGLYDHAMLRFSRGHKISENLYVRQDGTRSYFFSKEMLSHLFTSCGFEVLFNEYNRRSTVNRKEDIDVPRIFVQGKFKKI